MEYLLVFFLNIIGAGLVPDEGRKNRLMGQWPYNFVLLISMLALVVGDFINQFELGFVFSIILTAIFYGSRILRKYRNLGLNENDQK